MVPSELQSPSEPEQIALIWAMAENRVIAKGEGLPWRLPSELALFKRLTMGKSVIMGRRTFESIGCKPLPGRTNIVLSRTLAEVPPAVVLAHDLDAALRAARTGARRSGQAEIMVLGGAELYAQTLPMATRLYMTIVHCRPDGDTWFPEFDRDAWRCISSLESRSETGDEYAYTHYVLARS